MAPRENWSSTPRRARKRPILEGVTLAPEVLDELKARCAGKAPGFRSQLVERALRRELDLPEKSETGT